MSRRYFLSLSLLELSISLPLEMAQTSGWKKAYQWAVLKVGTMERFEAAAMACPVAVTRDCKLEPHAVGLRGDLLAALTVPSLAPIWAASKVLRRGNL